ncbi:uncharacterized protein LOC122250354 [Penaeus japonicus]|uniref:uncharacterized protein LOC122250354 n=1 Tax=Penaeus japonicus TaxID=27405 RepID=UPI001C70E4A4|nr:uncharacterized protein LOC122250354 [Penaeus japonicus]
MPTTGHNWYGNVSFVVNFKTFLQTFSHFNIYFVEVAEYQSQNASRLLFTSKSYDMRQYKPEIKGGPWYVDSNNDHWFLRNARRFNSRNISPFGHTLELILELSDVEAATLFQISSNQVADHSQANSPGYMKCKKYRSGQHWVECPTPLSEIETVHMLKNGNITPAHSVE